VKDWTIGEWVMGAFVGLLLLVGWALVFGGIAAVYYPFVYVALQMFGGG
jgi:hypothetical protein